MALDEKEEEKLHQIVAICLYLAVNGYEETATKLKLDIKKRYGRIPRQLEGKWEWIKKKNGVTSNEKESSNSVEEIKGENPMPARKDRTMHGKKAATAATPLGNTNVTPVSVEMKIESKEKEKNVGNEKEESSEEEDDDSDEYETDSEEEEDSSDEESTEHDESTTENGETDENPSRKVKFSDVVDERVMSPRKPGEREACFYNKADMKRFERENRIRKAEEAQLQLEKLIAATGETMGLLPSQYSSTTSSVLS